MRLSKDEYFCDFSIRASESRLHDVLRKLEGPHRITIKKWRRKRTNPQNALYWVAIVAPFAEWAREQGNECSEDDAHEFFKRKFLTRELKDSEGNVIGETVGSTTELDTAGFSEFFENCARWLAQFAGIVVNG